MRQKFGIRRRKHQLTARSRIHVGADPCAKKAQAQGQRVSVQAL
jgi:hypothetical protein